jgi:hypothetical protein
MNECILSVTAVKVFPDRQKITTAVISLNSFSKDRKEYVWPSRK